MADDAGACQTTNKGTYDPDEEKNAKKLQPLDEDDIALLKTYVSVPGYGRRGCDARLPAHALLLPRSSRLPLRPLCTCAFF